MQVVKPQGDASQEGYRGRLEVSPTGSIPRRENPAGKSPMTRSKPLGPSFASGSKHQREYGHGHASPDRSVETSCEQNQISQTKVHGTRGRRRRWHDRFRLRFRLVSPVPADSDGKSGAPIQRCSTNSFDRSPPTGRSERPSQHFARPLSGRLHRTSQPPRFARWCTPRCSATSFNRARLAAK
jgi:hypothetical protein